MEPQPLLDEHLMQLMNIDVREEFRLSLAEAVQRMAPSVDAILLSQFSMATELSDLKNHRRAAAVGTPQRRPPIQGVADSGSSVTT